MYCKNCGSEIADGSKFCSNCGQPVADQGKRPVEAASAADNEAVRQTETKKSADSSADNVKTAGEETAARPVFEEFSWNVADYPDRNVIEKTDDIDFNWNANPDDIPDPKSKRETVHNAEPHAEPRAAAPAEKAAPREPEVLKGRDLEQAVFGQADQTQKTEPLSASERIDKFYTFNKKNEEFQKLLNREYQKVKGGNAIEQEMSEADALASEKFRERSIKPASMDEFLESEGIVKPYQPKAFQSDVLQRIEAQEAEKEAKRLEEEARAEALEQARKEAEEKKKAEAEKLAEIARKKAEEEARAAEAERMAAEAAEQARIKAEEEKKRAEEERIKAEEEKIRQEHEARLRAEEEARKLAEEEARIKAEAEAKIREAEEARLKAEADLRAAQEAAKIRAQQEARLAAEEEARFKAEQERHRLAEEEAQRKLEAERQKLAAEANQAVAQEEARKVLEQTARMRQEEAAKIKAAVADLRSDAADQAGAENTVHPRKEVEEAHQATKNQINEMARARDEFFAQFEDEAEPEKKRPEAPEKPEQKKAAEEESHPVTGRDTMLSSNDMSKTRIVDKAAILAGINDDTKVVPEEEIKKGITEEDDKFFESLQPAGVAGVTAGVAAGAAAAAAAEKAAAGEAPAAEAKPVDFKKEEQDQVDDLLSQFESVNGMDENKPADKPAAQEEKPQLNDTVVMPQSEQVKKAPVNDFDNYGVEEAANYIKQQEQNKNIEKSAMDDFYGDDFYDDDDEEGLTKKELRQREKERKKQEKLRAREEKARKRGIDADFGDGGHDDDDEHEGGGKGRLALKIVLVVLIVILAAEVVGIGIRFLAPQSKAAEFIDSQLNKVIQLITGDDTEYSVIAAQVRAEPMEDKTDLITAQMDRNKNNNIKEIVYSSDLGYDQETDGEISDLVLSQPMIQVEWGRDEDNYPVYYDEEVVGEMIAFASNKVELMNKGNERALKMIDGDSNLYTETAALKNRPMNGEFEKLEIGEIRQAGSNYYIWVRETIGGTSAEKVYSMYPEREFVMKMAACYEV